MVHLDNPAGRIEAILKAAQQLVGQREGIDAPTGWIAVFQVDNATMLPEKIAEFIQQAQHARALVEELPPDLENIERLLGYFPELDKLCLELLSVGNRHMRDFAQFINVPLIDSMGACSDAIRRNNAREPTINLDGIPQLIETVVSIRGEITESDIHFGVKIFILKKLTDIENALLAVQLGGISNIESAMDAFVGACWRYMPHESREQTKNWAVRLWDGLLSFTQRTASIAKSAQDATESYKAITGS